GGWKARPVGSERVTGAGIFWHHAPPMSSLDIAIIALYFLGVLAVGFHASRRIHGLGDFVVAGRTLTAPILVGSLVATYYGLDVSLLALLIAGRVRESRALTLPDYFMARF